MSSIIEGLVRAWEKNADYGRRLVADLSDEQMILQPAPEGHAASNHPAWVLSHLNVYIPIIASLIKGEEFDDPKPHKFGMESVPLSDPAVYAPKKELIDEFSAGHVEVAQLLRDADLPCLENDVKLERWKEPFGKVGIALPYLMLLHENMHLGQVSAWRRIQGMPSV